MAFVFVFGTIGTISANAEEKNVPKRTIMFYAIGSNLEAQSRCFTKKVIEFSNSPYNENLDIIVITGGTEKWHTPAEYLDGADEIDVEYDQVWKVVGKKDGEEHGSFKLIEPTGMPGFEKANMGDPETLKAFMDYCYDNYPADIYDIILWDHGGGPVGGYGHDDRFNSMMRLNQLVSAFADSKLIKVGKKFNLIDFDACLMSNVTIITALGAFADYLVLSPEVEYDPAQRHLRMLETLSDNPSLNGYEMGKIIADDFADYFNNMGYAATLSVINTKNFKERMLPLVRELDGIFISEASKIGEKNNKYNFYDEMYSLLYSFVFAQDEYSLYDLGNLVGALSVPMSEMDNISSEERAEYVNAYTDIAKRILAVLSDCDDSGDDVLYFNRSNVTYQTVGAGVLRSENGELVYADDDGKSVVVPTGMSILFADLNINMSSNFVKRIKSLLDADYTDDEKEFFKARMTTSSYYGLIFILGDYVSCMKRNGVDNISYPDVKKEIENDEYWDKYCVPLLDWLVESGEFADSDELEGYLTNVVAQQSLEAISADKVTARPVESIDGSFDNYLVTVNNSSAQVLMTVESLTNVVIAKNETPEYLGFFKHVYGDHSLNDLYPDGISLDLFSGKGELDLALYYNSTNDTLAELYERIYSSSTSVWTLPRAKEECLVMYDLDGGAHLINLHYIDDSHEYAYMPLNMYHIVNDSYHCSNLILRKVDGEWSICGISNNQDDLLSFVLATADVGFEKFLITPGAIVTDAVYDYTTTVPIGSFFPVDVTKDNLGLTFGYAKLAELDEVSVFSESYVLSDVYGIKINIDSAIEAADEAAKQNDFVRDISVTDITVTDTFFTGREARPDVTVVYEGRTLENGVDYKVIYDGSSNRGNAYLMVFGIGDFNGVIDFTYTIKAAPVVKVDGKEISKDNYTVDEITGAVTLKEEYVKTLSAGNHTLTVILSGAETTTDFTVSPQAGNNSHIEIWIIILIVLVVCAVVAICIFLLCRRKKASKEQ